MIWPLHVTTICIYRDIALDIAPDVKYKKLYNPIHEKEQCHVMSSVERQKGVNYQTFIYYS